MMVYVRLEDGEVFVKEGAVFLEGGESKRKLSSKGDIDRGGSSAFFLSWRSWKSIAERAGS